MTDEIRNVLVDDLDKIDEVLLQIADGLDAKASFVLVIITLLAAFSGEILSMATLPLWIKLTQMISVAAMVVAVIFALIALWPVDFLLRPMPEVWESFVSKSKEEKAAVRDEQVIDDLRASRRRVGERRIGHNRQRVKTKAIQNDGAFYATAAAIATQVVTLIWLASSRL